MASFVSSATSAWMRAAVASLGFDLGEADETGNFSAQNLTQCVELLLLMNEKSCRTRASFADELEASERARAAAERSAERAKAETAQAVSRLAALEAEALKREDARSGDLAGLRQLNEQLQREVSDLKLQLSTATHKRRSLEISLDKMKDRLLQKAAKAASASWGGAGKRPSSGITGGGGPRGGSRAVTPLRGLSLSPSRCASAQSLRGAAVEGDEEVQPTDKRPRSPTVALKSGPTTRHSSAAPGTATATGSHLPLHRAVPLSPPFSFSKPRPRPFSAASGRRPGRDRDTRAVVGSFSEGLSLALSVGSGGGEGGAAHRAPGGSSHNLANAMRESVSLGFRGEGENRPDSCLASLLQDAAARDAVISAENRRLKSRVLLLENALSLGGRHEERDRSGRVGGSTANSPEETEMNDRKIQSRFDEKRESHGDRGAAALSSPDFKTKRDQLAAATPAEGAAASTRPSSLRPSPTAPLPKSPNPQHPHGDLQGIPSTLWGQDKQQTRMKKHNEHTFQSSPGRVSVEGLSLCRSDQETPGGKLGEVSSPSVLPATSPSASTGIPRVPPVPFVEMRDSMRQLHREQGLQETVNRNAKSPTDPPRPLPLSSSPSGPSVHSKSFAELLREDLGAKSREALGDLPEGGGARGLTHRWLRLVDQEGGEKEKEEVGRGEVGDSTPLFGGEGKGEWLEENAKKGEETKESLSCTSAGPPPPRPVSLSVSPPTPSRSQHSCGVPPVRQPNPAPEGPMRQDEMPAVAVEPQKAETIQAVSHWVGRGTLDRDQRLRQSSSSPQQLQGWSAGGGGGVVGGVRIHINLDDCRGLPQSSPAVGSPAQHTACSRCGSCGVVPAGQAQVGGPRASRGQQQFCSNDCTQQHGSRTGSALDEPRRARGQTGGLCCRSTGGEAEGFERNQKTARLRTLPLIFGPHIRRYFENLVETHHCLSHLSLALHDDEEVWDVVVVGSGLHGCSFASRLKQENPQAKVVLLEGRDIPCAHYAEGGWYFWINSTLNTPDLRLSFVQSGKKYDYPHVAAPVQMTDLSGHRWPSVEKLASLARLALFNACAPVVFGAWVEGVSRVDLKGGGKL
uniref:Uncharacterized protein n=1 Tax=Chromera velia CCMP2878 TaxID=1169474 RepID=A0A0G4G6L8_9ALVE|eukprot:Cvel_20523.t1-p1 / transcript=Cvel_20523.t1 / gene=Cvel_20523 / organism=Chromera_velia_CCMP2878 / gene_product=hypothetical protein / transcript_product=hypothetical protein / location=Cvel_scaffold1848:30329-37165(-) / protein_length=1080 / sequence_SO=supercontig / SO=protein_coding / is_pseudo=false